MASKAGIKKIGFCTAGTLLTTPTNKYSIGLREKVGLVISDTKQIEDYKNRKLPNMKNFKIEPVSLQPTLDFVEKLLGYINLGADVQIVTNPQSASANSEDVFQFVGDNKIGIGFELEYTQNKRSLKIMMEESMEKSRAQTLIDAADSNTEVALGFIGDGSDFSRFRAPSFGAIEIPKSTAIANLADVVDRSLKISTKGTKTQYDVDEIDWLAVEIMVKYKTASIADLVTMLSKSIAPAVYWEEFRNGDAAIYDAFDFAAGLLSLNDDFEINDEARTITAKLTGDIPVYDVKFEYGTGKGGDIGDTDAINGGTMKFSA